MKRPRSVRELAWLVTRCVLVLAAVATVISVVFVLPPRMVAKDRESLATAEKRLKAENDIRATLVQSLGGAALISGLYISYRTLRANREGQITERFTRAIDQLGHDGRIDVRVGGIYALERIARASQEDHGPIMEVLAAFLRHHALWSPDSEPIDPQKWRSPPPDVQAAASVLGRRSLLYEGASEGHPILVGVDLRFANLRDAHLERFDLRDAHLEGATLRGAHLDSACLLMAHFQGANLSAASLKNALMGGAHFEGADLTDARLDGAGIQRVHFDGHTKLTGTHVEGAIIIDTVLTADQLKCLVTDHHTHFLSSPAGAADSILPNDDYPT